MWVQISENIFSDVSKNVKFDDPNIFCLFLDMYLDILDETYIVGTYSRVLENLQYYMYLTNFFLKNLVSVLHYRTYLRFENN